MSIASTDNQQSLPDGFQPGPKDVVIGKGKKFYFHEGNAWLRKVVSSMLDEYKKATTKPDKSLIISDVVELVRRNGRFVKIDLQTEEWVYAEELLCREKCSQTFRDALHDTYKSSNVAKKNKRRREQQQKVVAEKKAQAGQNVQAEAKRARAAQTSPARKPTTIPSKLFEWEGSSPQLGAIPRMTALPRNPPTGHDIISILADAISLSSIDDEVDNPFEPTPLPEDSTPSGDTMVATQFEDFKPAPMSRMPMLPTGLSSEMPRIPTAAFLKDDHCNSDPRPLRFFEQTPATFKGEDSFDELSTISDLEALIASNEESYDLGPNIHAAFAA